MNQVYHDLLQKMSGDSNWPEINKDITKQALKDNPIPLKDVIHGGNMKLPRDTAIFNMGSATDCPSCKVGLCQAVVDGKVICYAMKAEIQYPNVKPYRERQGKFWKKVTASDFALQFMLINAKKRMPYKALRINESCDFWEQSCVVKAEEIAKRLNHYGIPVYIYTARKDLDFSFVTRLVINGSNFTKPGVLNDFKMIMHKEDRPKDYAICPGDCRICTRCQQPGKKTVVLRH